MTAGLRAIVPRRLGPAGPEQGQTAKVVSGGDTAQNAEGELLQRVRKLSVGMALVQSNERVCGGATIVRELGVEIARDPRGDLFHGCRVVSYLAELGSESDCVG